MAYLQVTNRAETTLASSILAADVSLSVAAGEGVLFPSSNFAITIENERILVGSRTTDTFSSLTRGYDGTTPADHASGVVVELRVIAKHITELQDGKRDIVARVQSVTDAATVTPNADTNDAVDITALAQAVTIAAPTGTPTNFQKLTIRFKDNGTARGISWNAAYVAGGVSLPSTTVLSKIMTCGFIYNTANSLNKWQCVAVSTEA